MQMPKGGEDPFLFSSVYTQGKGGLWVKLTKPASKRAHEGVRMSDTKERDHQRFLKHLDESFNGVMSAARWLNRLGYTTVMPPSTSSEKYADRMKHVDGGDLFIQQRIEVKTLGVSFTSASDWPFGAKFIVCAKHSYDNATPKPFAYLIQSADMKCIASVPASTASEWYVETRTDTRYEDYTQEFYLCPLKLVKFFRI